MHYRHKAEENKTLRDLIIDPSTEWIKEGSVNQTRDLTDSGFYGRYQYEAEMLSDIIKTGKFASILEIGSGPGTLAQMLLEKHPNIYYTMIDGEGAYKVWKERNYKGIFMVQDMEYQLDISRFTVFDLIIINDFLEHVRNPSDILTKCQHMMHNKSQIFISVPNWRMGHLFVYPGLFDYDNFMKFLMIHEIQPLGVQGSNLRCQFYPKLDSEKMLLDELITSWNWYFLGKKNV